MALTSIGEARRTRILSYVAADTPLTSHRGERVLAFMAAAVVGLSVLAIIALFVVRSTGGTPWPIVLVLPGVGIPIALLLIIALLVVSTVRRVRGSRDA